MHKSDLTTLGVNIRSWRKKRKLSMDALSEMCGISSRHLASIEHGRINPSFDVLYSIVHSLAISSDILFYPNLPEHDKRLKVLLAHYECCPPEDQDLVLHMVECLIYHLPKRN